eukprot:1153598-Pelagomonas_calceolata.AAC.3
MAAAIAANSALTMVLVICVPFSSTNLKLAIVGAIIFRVVESCSYHLFSKVDMAAAICVCPIFPVLNFSDQVWARCGKRREGLLVLDGVWMA